MLSVSFEAELLFPQPMVNPVNTITRKKIVHIQLLPLLSGAQNVMLKILESLDRDKYEIYVISKPGGPLVKKVKELGYKHVPLNSFRRNISFMDIIAFIKLYKIFKKYKFDIVHTHSSKPGFLGRIAARIAGVPKIIHTVHGFPFHPYQNKYIIEFYKAMEKFAALFCDKVVFVNNSERETAISDRLVQPEKAVTIYNGIELPKINQRQRKKSDGLVIGSTLRFWNQKNIFDTIEAAIQVCKKSERIKFIFVGHGELYKDVEDIVNKSGFKDRIQLPGWQNNVTDWLQKFDVFLLPDKRQLSRLGCRYFLYPRNDNGPVADKIPLNGSTDIFDGDFFHDFSRFGNGKNAKPAFLHGKI